MKGKIKHKEEIEQMLLIFSYTQMLLKFEFSDEMLMIVLANAAAESAEVADKLTMINN